MFHFLSKLFGRAMRGTEELEREIAARKMAEDALQTANAELKQQVEALRAGEGRFRLLVEGTSDYAIFMLDPTGRIASWNPGAQRIAFVSSRGARPRYWWP